MKKAKMQINILDKFELAAMWPVSDFMAAYQKTPKKLAGASVFTLTNPGETNKAAILIFRLFVEDSHRLQNEQKYVLGLRFYSFGDIATIDIIALNKEYHREIAYSHLVTMDWPVLNEDPGGSSRELEASMHTPCLISGGYLQIDSQGQLSFAGQSQDYGGTMLTFDSNNIANFLVSTIPGVEINDHNLEAGKKFVQQILEIMLQHNNQKNFYEKLLEHIYSPENDDQESLSAQQIGALAMMKIADRALMENLNFLHLTVDEFSSGLSRYIMLLTVAKKIRRQKKQKKDNSSLN